MQYKLMDKEYNEKISLLKTNYIDILLRYLVTKEVSVVKGSQLMDAHTIVFALGDRDFDKSPAALHAFFLETLTEYNKAVALRRIQEKQGKDIITEFAVQWNSYTILAYWLAKAFQYLERNYLKKPNALSLCQTALNKFQEEVFKPVIKTIVKTLFEQLEAERSGELVDWVKVKRTLHCFRAMGMKKATIAKDDKGELIWNGASNLDFYKENFEGEFISQSTVYYEQEASKWITQMNCPEYVHRALDALKKEEEKAVNFLDPETRPRLVKLIEDKVLIPYAEKLTNMSDTGLVKLLQDKRIVDLKAMGTLFARRRETIPHIIAKLGPYIHERGEALQEDKALEKDGIAYMTKMTALKKEVDELIEEAFNNGEQYVKVKDQQFSLILGEFTQAPTYLAEYIDNLMVRGLKGKESEIDALLDLPFSLFRLLKSKDVFTHHHQMLYAQRLLNSTSISDNAEESFISKMKIELGSQYVSMYVQMKQDIRGSEDEDKYFTTHTTGNALQGITLKTKVLTTGIWKLKSNTTCKLPAALAQCAEQFERCYIQRHTGRVIKWCVTQGDCEISIRGLAKPYIVITSVYQAAILDAFNSKDTYTFQELQAETKIPPDVLTMQLNNLTNPKMGALLLKANSKTPKFTQDEIISFNSKFAFSSLRLFLQPTAVRTKKTEVTTHEAEELKMINKERAIRLQVILVRIMKGRKSERHNILIDETIKQCIAFHPEPMMIKSQIE